MHMGMILQTPGVGVQYGGHADLSPQMFWVKPEVFQGAEGNGEQDVVYPV